ncbi:MAG: CheR family methyltransferase [Flavobacteriales bacterium]
MEIEIDIQDIRKLVNTVKTKYGFDFGEYALSSFKRRLVRILDLYKFMNMTELINKVNFDKTFYELFLKEITVNTTEMFRDPSMWKKFRETVVPELAKLPSIRIWHSACSSGEEVYSMAILLKEAGLLDKTKFLASDINEDVIATARSGKYPLRNMPLHSDNYDKAGGMKKLTDYYKTNGDYAYMDLSLIHGVVFKKFDLVLGKQEQKFDVILCRNVLIYFNLPLQDKIIEMFSGTVDPGAFLVVGSKESIAWCKSATKYSTFSFEEKIYRKI